MAQKRIDTAPEQYQKFNKEVQQWTGKSSRSFKKSIRTKKAVKTGRLVKSMKGRTYKRDGVVEKVAYTMERYGVFVQKGVGKNRPIGTVAARRAAKDWFNSVMAQQLVELSDIAQANYAEIATKSIFIK